MSYSSPVCSTSGNISPTLNGTAGGTYSSTGGLSINASTGVINVGASTPNTYMITYFVGTALPSGCNASTTASVTITAAPTGTISYTSPFCTSDGVQSVTQTGTGGGIYTVSPAGLTINSSTGAITPGTSSANTYTVTYTIAAS
ncbi:MAG: hypothetical protein JKY30_13965, partial [Flavobacteriales bacterium]|nr:hypothetical protein [Flavobacteriales bacterium]